jgi:hypothetical protein
MERGRPSSVCGRIDRVNSLSRVLTRTRKAEVTERKVLRMPNVQSGVMAPVESRFYELVTQAIRQYAWEHDVSDGFLLATPQRQLSSCIYAAAASWGAQDDDSENEESLYEDIGVDFVAGPISDFRRFVLDNIRGQYDLETLRREDSKFKCLQVFSKISLPTFLPRRLSCFRISEELCGIYRGA